jgi:dihydropteroate synthase
VEGLVKRLSVPVSIDTTKAAVARRALDAGACIINDIGAMQLDPDMAPLVADADVPVILMHMKGTPKDMQVAPSYEDVVSEVKVFFQKLLVQTEQAGIGRDKVIIDPGIGFGKTVTHNLLLIKHLSMFHSLGVPILIGPSRKSFITKILGSAAEDGREVGTQAAVAVAAYQGVHMVRVHDVARTKQTVGLVDALRSAGRS